MKKTVLITGATAGIGKAVAELLAKNDYRLILTGRRTNRLKELEEQLSGLTQLICLNFDIRDRNQVESNINELPDEWKKIDVLINNAGLAAGMAHLDKGEVDDWERMIDTNIKGLLYITRVVSPLMIENKSGHIVNIASLAGKEAYENGNVYVATKHAVDALSRSMRIDFLKHNIRVTNIAPGLVDTEFSTVRFHGDKQRADKVYSGLKPLYAEDIAEVILFAISRLEHVNIDDILIKPTAQATSAIVNRSE